MKSTSRTNTKTSRKSWIFFIFWMVFWLKMQYSKKSFLVVSWIGRWRHVMANGLSEKDFAAFLVRTETSVSDICRLQTADYRLQTADRRLQTTDYRLHTEVLRPKITRRWLRTAGCKSWRPWSLIRQKSLLFWNYDGKDDMGMCSVDSVTVKWSGRWPRKAYCILDSIISP